MKLIGSESLSGRGHFACGGGFPFQGGISHAAVDFLSRRGISHAAVDFLSRRGISHVAVDFLSRGSILYAVFPFQGEHFACGRCEEGKHS